jgi:hypothetical protein
MPGFMPPLIGSRTVTSVWSPRSFPPFGSARSHRSVASARRRVSVFGPGVDILRWGTVVGSRDGDLRTCEPAPPHLDNRRDPGMGDEDGRGTVKPPAANGGVL